MSQPRDILDADFPLPGEGAAPPPSAVAELVAIFGDVVLDYEDGTVPVVTVSATSFRRIFADLDGRGDVTSGQVSVSTVGAIELTAAVTIGEESHPLTIKTRTAAHPGLVIRWGS